MSHITLRHYHSTLGYIQRDPEQASLFKTRRSIYKSRHEVPLLAGIPPTQSIGGRGYPEPEAVSKTRRKIKSALREFIKGGLA